ncbi:unnamed protein product [Phytophthora fragariaefolia]|uniref:Unnamed protein product n=1 Tax=Phytophthora fragariaefolia TaxID=1490495 RepID=A0A9W6YAP6_9STRA|nr:unnamed protein product [Phytophthora fragariaefolia]
MEAVTALAEGCWRVGVAIYLQAVWRWRIGHFDEINDVTEEYHTRVLETKLRHGYSTVHLHMRATQQSQIEDMAATILKRALGHRHSKSESHIIAPVGQMYVLFYGGRTKGKEGAAGCGAVVLRIDTKTKKSTACWLGHMSYAGSRMTAFAANASGLHIGIAECVKRNYRPLHIIGDNSVLVNQHKRRKPPKAQHLRNL